MADPTPQQLIADPRFHALPMGDRISALAGIDPDFAKMNPADRIRAMSQLAPEQQAPNAGLASPGQAPQVNMAEQPSQFGSILNSLNDTNEKFKRGYKDFVGAVAQDIPQFLSNPGLYAGSPIASGVAALKNAPQTVRDIKTFAATGNPPQQPSGSEVAAGLAGINTEPTVDAYAQKNYPALAGHMVTPILAGMGFAALGDQMRGAPKSSTDKYITNLSGAIGENGKSINVPAEVGNVIGDVRQTAANEGMTAADFKGGNAAGGVRNAIGKTLENHEANYQQLFDSIRSNPVPDAVKMRIKSAIGSEVSNAMESIMPEDAASINALKSRAENLNTWEDINDARQLMNRASQAAWKKPEAMQLNSPNHTQALQTGSNVIREELYNEIGRANGLSPDAIRALKQKEGSLLKLDAMTEGIENKTANSQAAYDSMTKWEKIRQGKTFTEAAKEAIPLIGKMSPQELIASKAGRAFSNLPEPNGGIGIAPNVARMPQSPRQLPQYAGSGNFNLGAPHPGMTAGEFRSAVAQQARQGKMLQLPEQASGWQLGQGEPATSLGERLAARGQLERERMSRVAQARQNPPQVQFGGQQDISGTPYSQFAGATPANPEFIPPSQPFALSDLQSILDAIKKRKVVVAPKQNPNVRARFE